MRGLATAWTYFLHLSLSSVILIDSFTESPVHVLMLSIQAVRGLPRLRAPGIVPCIISLHATPLFPRGVPQTPSYAIPRPDRPFRHQRMSTKRLIIDAASHCIEVGYRRQARQVMRLSLKSVYTLQPVAQPVAQPSVNCKHCVKVGPALALVAASPG